MKGQIETFLKSITNYHSDKGDNIVIFSTPRSGSTWLMELIKTQPDFKICNEPLNIRNTSVAKALGVNKWAELYSEKNSKILKNYFQEIISGKHLFLNGNPFRKYHRPLTSRIVFKIINGGELMVNEIAEVSKSKVLYLIRHPVSVALSREQLPRLETLINKDITKGLNLEEIKKIEKYKNDDSHIVRATLSWCIQNKLALNRSNADWVILTYEQLVVDPKPIVEFISYKFKFKKRQRIFANLKRPSTVTVQSRVGTKEYIKKANEYDLINRYMISIHLCLKNI